MAKIRTFEIVLSNTDAISLHDLTRIRNSSDVVLKPLPSNTGNIFIGNGKDQLWPVDGGVSISDLMTHSDEADFDFKEFYIRVETAGEGFYFLTTER